MLLLASSVRHETTYKMPGNRKRPSAKRSLDFENEDAKPAANNDVVDLTSSSPAVVRSTPQKKKQKRDIKSYFSSPVPTITSSAPETAAVVTPPDAKKPKATKTEEKKEEGYVPTYIHKSVDYAREGKAQLDPIKEKVYHLIEDHYVIPPGFETNRKYGPISVVCFEERVIAGYRNNLLEPKGEDQAVEICTHCAESGHVRDGCQDLI